MTASSTVRPAEAAEINLPGGGTRLTFANGFWSVEIELSPSVNPCRLVHLASGDVVADTDYCYRIVLESAEGGSGYVGGAQSARAVRFMDWTTVDGEGTRSLVVNGRVDFGREGPTDIVLRHTFTLFEGSDRFEEEIALIHRFGRDTHVLADYRLGFRKRMFDNHTGRGWTASMRTSWCRSRSGGGAPDAGLAGRQLLGGRSRARELGGPEPAQSPVRSLELARPRARVRFRQILPRSRVRPGRRRVLYAHRRGRAGWARRLPTSATSACAWRRRPHAWRAGRPGAPLGDRAEYASARPRSPFAGGWEDGHRAYAGLMRARGHVTPVGFNPPVHWNELYELSWRGGTNAPLQEPSEIWAQAEIAQAFGAEAFYFDPVWDIFEGSSIWDTERLGPLPDFVRRMKEQYGLETSLHLMMHTKSMTEDPRIYRRDSEGNIVRWRGLYEGGYVCPACAAWKDLKTERLLELAQAGVTFFMFDFCDYHLKETGTAIAHHSSEPCWSPDHGHAVPMSLEEHSRGVVEVMQRVKAAFPDLLIEAHDRVSGGIQDYMPLYYEHNLNGTVTFDEHWGFEYMWNPYMDLLSGKALSLYEYNLAFDIPLYLHINLNFDNVQALSFWWYASTCRHLGLGGLKPGHRNWEGHVAAMQEYRRLKPFFAQGRFVGFGRMVHGHVLDDRRALVVTAFNLGSDAVDIGSNSISRSSACREDRPRRAGRESRRRRWCCGRASSPYRRRSSN